MSFSTKSFKKSKVLKENIKMKTEGKSPNALSTNAQKSSRIAINSAFENINSVLESILEKFASEKPIPFPPENTFSLIDKKAYTKLLDENKRLREKIKKSEEKSAKNAKGVNLSIESNDELKFDLTETTSKIDQKSRKTTDSTGEINLKILIEKESAIRDLRFKIDHLQSENKKLTEQKLILQRIGQPAKNETLRTIGKSANIYGPKTQRYFKKSKEKLPAQNSLWKPRNSVVGHKKESTDKFLLKNGKTATKKPLIITNEKAKNFERSVSEPRSKIQAKPYKTPVRSSIKKRLKFAKASDDAILSTIKFKKTRVFLI
ncbi:hypothetical protein MHBO_001662 [Bonamia ostreae]|uniref:Uncharacterized protein n=1 Tax=Bonamia ostreae TaxID=126728 RepID=A0ABV2AKC7_9EUKA